MAFKVEITAIPQGIQGVKGETGDTGPQGIQGPAGSDASAPTGGIIMFGSSSAPSGYLLCNGAAVGRSTYAALFAVIGTTFGVGDGMTTFNVPDLRGRVAVGMGQGSGLSDRIMGVTGGEENHALTAAENAAHTHTVSLHSGYAGSATIGGSPAGLTNTQTSSSSGSGTAHNTMQPFLIINFIIKT